MGIENSAPRIWLTEVGRRLGKNTEALTQFPLVSCAQETEQLWQWCPRNEDLGFSFGHESVCSRGHLGHNRSMQTQTGLHCARESLALHREICLLGSALPETIRFLQARPLRPLKTSLLHFNCFHFASAVLKIMEHSVVLWLVHWLQIQSSLKKLVFRKFYKAIELFQYDFRMPHPCRLNLFPSPPNMSDW